MSKLTIGEAAALLHTAPSTIRSWEQRLGYPTPDRSTSGRRLYDEHEIALLADALRRGLSISSAIRQVRVETGSPPPPPRQAPATGQHPARGRGRVGGRRPGIRRDGPRGGRGDREPGRGGRRRACRRVDGRSRLL